MTCAYAVHELHASAHDACPSSTFALGQPRRRRRLTPMTAPSWASRPRLRPSRGRSLLARVVLAWPPLT